MDDFDADALGLPKQFGKEQQTAKTKEEIIAQYAEEFRKLSSDYKEKAPPAPAVHEEEPEEYEVEEDVDEEEARRRLTLGGKLPISHEIAIKSHEKAVSAFALDGVSNRLYTGSLDTNVAIHDFGGMDLNMKPFRSFVSTEGNPVTDISCQPASGRGVVAVATRNNRPNLYDRDGLLVATFIKGDQYLHDMKKTKGHTQTVTSIGFCPCDECIVLTSSLDGTVRLWDLETVERSQNVVVKPKVVKGGLKVQITSCVWSKAGDKFAAAIPAEGTIQVWNRRSSLNKPNIFIGNAHKVGEAVTSLCFMPDGNTLVSRCVDETMKVWDLRKPKECVHTWKNLPTFTEIIDCCCSPDGEYLLTASNAMPGSGGRSALLFYEMKTLDLVKMSNFDHMVHRIKWDEKTNEIFVSLSDGSCRVLFDPDKSEKGVLLPLARGRRKVDESDMVSIESKVYNVPAVDVFEKEIPDWKLVKMIEREERERKGIKTATADAPTEEPGLGGRLGFNPTQYMLRKMGLVKPEIEMDPREELLRYAEADKNPVFTKVYSETQPKQIFSEENDEEKPPMPKKPKGDVSTRVHLF